MVNATPRPLYPRERYTFSIVQEVEWVARPILTDAENLAPGGIRSPDRPFRSDYTISAILTISIDTNTTILRHYYLVSFPHSLPSDVLMAETRIIIMCKLDVVQ